MRKQIAHFPPALHNLLEDDEGFLCYEKSFEAFGECELVRDYIQLLFDTGLLLMAGRYLLYYVDRIPARQFDANFTYHIVWEVTKQREALPKQLGYFNFTIEGDIVVDYLFDVLLRIPNPRRFVLTKHAMSSYIRTHLGRDVIIVRKWYDAMDARIRPALETVCMMARRPRAYLPWLPVDLRKMLIPYVFSALVDFAADECPLEIYAVDEKMRKINV